VLSTDQRRESSVPPGPGEILDRFLTGPGEWERCKIGTTRGRKTNLLTSVCRQDMLLSMNKVRVSLQASEGLVFEAASRIYAAYLRAGKISDGREGEWMERSLREAIQLARLTDQSVQSDAELD
jgi:hypothetical protein